MASPISVRVTTTIYDRRMQHHNKIITSSPTDIKKEISFKISSPFSLCVTTTILFFWVKFIFP